MSIGRKSLWLPEQGGDEVARAQKWGLRDWCWNSAGPGVVAETQCLKEMLPEREGAKVSWLLPHLLPTRLLPGPSKGTIYLGVQWQGSPGNIVACDTVQSQEGGEQDRRQTGNLRAPL